MADRGNLTIPINLAFMAALLAVSHLATEMAPTQQQTARAEMTASIEPVEDLNDARLVMKLTAVAMPALPDDVLPARPVADQPASNAKAPPIPILAVAAKPNLPAPTPMMPRQASSTPAGPPLLRLDASGHNSFNLPSIVPMEKARLAPNLPRPRDDMLAALPVGDPVVSSSTRDRLDSIKLSPVMATALPQVLKPRTSDLQMADRLMDDAAQKLSLEFLWPSDRRVHSGIYSRLTECLGVEIGVIDRDGNVYVGTGGGRVFNAALHSPFMRLVDQPVDPRERQNIKRIRTGLQITAKNGTAVRVFRRENDIRLLAALNRAFGGLPTSGWVTAEYQIEAGALYLGKLKLNGRLHDGRIRLDRDSCV